MSYVFEGVYICHVSNKILTHTKCDCKISRILLFRLWIDQWKSNKIVPCRCVYCIKNTWLEKKHQTRIVHVSADGLCEIVYGNIVMKNVRTHMNMVRFK